MARRLKKVTVNLPVETLERAQQQTGRGITETLVEGLIELEKRAQRSSLRRLRGQVHIELDLPRTRQ